MFACIVGQGRLAPPIRAGYMTAKLDAVNTNRHKKSMFLKPVVEIGFNAAFALRAAGSIRRQKQG